MALYAGRSVAWASVSNWGNWHSGGTSSSTQFYGDIPAQLAVTDLLVEFRVEIEFHDHPYADNGRGRFKVWLDLADSSGGFVQVDYAEKDLGNDHDNGDWSSHLTVGNRMVGPMELYRVRTECRTKDTSLGTSTTNSRIFTCTQAVNFIGDFTLDFIPLSIVYDPPGQDMTNSLSQTEEFGSQFTIGNSSSMQASQGWHAGGSLWGIISVDEGVQDSQSSGNTAVNSLRTTFFRNSVVTADNQRAIGRALWGPLSDLFVVMVNPRYAASQRVDGTIFYEHRDCDQVIIVPAYKLLRPGTDAIAGSIPEADRRKLLELDPFITNLDRFFPDVGTDLKEASNPFADPSANGRAECIGIWHLSTGVELNYSIGDQIELRQSNTEEMSWSTNMHGSAAVIIGGSFDTTTTVGIQWSLEASQRLAKSAACYLIKNQNDPEPEGIMIYYDKIFSTLMFRRVRTGAVVRSPDFPLWPYVFPDLRLEWILDKIREVLLDLGIPKINPPKPPLDPYAPDLGLSKSFPTLTKDVVKKLLDRLKTELVPSRALTGSARDAAGQPLYYETVQLLRGKQVIYQTFSDGMGGFRFDNLVPGKYTLRTGDHSEEVTVGVDNHFLKPARVSIKDTRRLIDLKKTSRGKLKGLLGIDNLVLDQVTKDHAKLKDLNSLADRLGLNKETRDVLAKRIKRV